MTPVVSKLKISFLILSLALVATPKHSYSQNDNTGAQLPQPIILTEPKEPLEDRLLRKITLDVRDMNVVDVIKFLAQKGEFNIVISPSVNGRTTVLLHSVGIKDALDIVAVSNKLAYHIDNSIVQIMTAAEYEARYGRSFSDKTIVCIIHLQYSKPSYVLAALDGMKSNLGKIIIDEDTGTVVIVDTPQVIEDMKKTIAQVEQPLDTLMYKLQYAKADVIAEKLRARIDAKAVGSISADERSNQLLIRVFPGREEETKKLIASLDKPTREVLIEARILQITFIPGFNEGIDWNALINSNGSNKFNIQGSLSGTGLANTFSQIGVGSSVDDFYTALKATHKISSSKILSNPQILITNNEEAKIHIGETVPYIVTTTNGAGDTKSFSEDVRFIDVGLKLDITPTINADGMVTLKMIPEIATVTGHIDSASGGSFPQINKTLAETKVMVHDGQTIILAGLRKENKSHVKQGIPGLMNLPYLGQFFTNTADALTSTETVILITPHIVKGDEDASQTLGTIKPAKAYGEKK
jgi:type II secretory pathway component GspD/PulD (secretin)